MAPGVELGVASGLSPKTTVAFIVTWLHEPTWANSQGISVMNGLFVLGGFSLPCLTTNWIQLEGPLLGETCLTVQGLGERERAVLGSLHVLC